MLVCSSINEYIIKEINFVTINQKVERAIRRLASKINMTLHVKTRVSRTLKIGDKSAAVYIDGNTTKMIIKQYIEKVSLIYSISLRNLY